MKACQCLPGATCEPMPNRFRKILHWKDWLAQDGFWIVSTAGVVTVPVLVDLPPEECEKLTKECDEAILAEFGEGFEGAWCVSMEPVILEGRKVEDDNSNPDQTSTTHPVR
jgi:hypothetical protein